MPREIAPVIAELLDAVDGIEGATRGKTLDDFREDWLLKHGVQRGLEIISEASRHLPDEVLAEVSDVPWSQVRGIGNIPRHEYHRISDPVVWAVVVEHLAALRRAAEVLRQRHGSGMPDA